MVKLQIPADRNVSIVSFSNSSFEQRCVINGTGVHQDWQGAGEGKLMGSKNLNLQHAGMVEITVENYYRKSGSQSWTPSTQQLQGPFDQPVPNNPDLRNYYIRSEDANDNDFNDCFTQIQWYK
jgi:hypothetical protein